MKLKTPLLTAAATLAATMAFSAGAQTAMPDSGAAAAAPKDTAATWATLDKDQDGLLTKKEASSDKQISKNFKALDVNKDGKLDQTELASLDSGAAGAVKPASTY